MAQERGGAAVTWGYAWVDANGNAEIGTVRRRREATIGRSCWNEGQRMFGGYSVAVMRSRGYTVQRVCIVPQGEVELYNA
jgi:hypothetical protein